MKDGLISAVAVLGMIAGILIGYAIPHPVAAETQEPETEAVTEATEPETEPPTEAPTELTTEPETEPEQETESGPDCYEFPNTCTIHRILTKNGYSEAVTAGIIGNMMAECGGQTMALRWDAYGDGGNYYGICQWNKWAYPEVQGQDLLFQISYLLETVESRFGENYQKFLDSDNPRDAALRFAVWYEGCEKWSYPVRQACAEQVFDYFVKGE